MFERDDLIGLLLLGLCVATAGILVYSISTGTRFRFTGPGWLGGVIIAVFIVALLYGMFTGRFGSGGRWPHPMGGRGRRRWPWSRDDDKPGQP